MGKAKYSFTIKELPEADRPREKLLKRGAEYLTDAELLALIIRTGNRERTAIELSQDILNYFGGLQSLINLSVEEIKEIKGMGIAKGAQINALVELSKRLNRAVDNERTIIRGPGDVANYLMSELRYLKQEIFKIILLDTKSQIIAAPVISKGGLSSSIVHPREVFKEAIRRSSAAIILAHNHPSGIPEPSEDDIKITRRLIKSGEIIGIEVLDHIVIGDGKFLSLKEKEFI